ncbi:MAG: sn-glycerol-3-phosphate ABC transporter ATP-binding protein UgpC [Candidatus Melainabacteria bacterium]|nr:sn-glycerol-3-phosphate ABC transporter ATP-binding protein UgpC [Candidatus Melainabacteria bacterium]
MSKQAEAAIIVAMAEVVFRQISKAFGSQSVLRHIDVTVQDQEFLVLVGPSGCGKSTLLRLLAGLESPTEGTIAIDGRVVNEVHPKDRDIAMVFQNYALYPHMSVFDNMAFGLKMRRTPKTQIRQRVEEAAKILELESLLTRKPKQLSGGQRQRVALGRAIVRNPKVFLMDEPLSNLDARLRQHMRVEIARLHQRLKATTIYVTHDQTEAMTLGDRIVVLNQGVVQEVDRPLVVYQQPSNRFVAQFMGTINLISGDIQADGLFTDATGTLRWPTGLSQSSGVPVEVGFRPEQLTPLVPECSEHSGQEGLAPGCLKLPLLLERVELLGSEQLVYGALPSGGGLSGVPLVARVSAEWKPVAAGETVWFALNAQHLLWFHPDTGERLPA